MGPHERPVAHHRFIAASSKQITQLSPPHTLLSPTAATAAMKSAARCSMLDAHESVACISPSAAGRCFNVDPKKRPVYGAAAWRARNRPPVPLARPWFHPKVDLFNPETDALKMRKLRNRIQNKVSLAKDWYHVAHVGR